MLFSDPQEAQEAVSRLRRELADLRKTLESKDQLIAELRQGLDKPHFDTLTGLADHRALLAFLNADEKESNHDSALSLIYIDLDKFKNINDSLGHQAGDEILKQYADLLRDTANSADAISRSGGDKFLLAIREPVGIAYGLAELIRSQTEAREFQFDNQKYHITVSIGIAERRPGQTAEHLIKEVDKCLYAAKSEGRNTIVTDSDLSSSAEQTGKDIVLADLENRIRVMTDRLASYLMIRSRQIAHHYKMEASKDGLTGIFNRGYLDRLIDRELRKVKVDKRTLTIAMVDLDDFGKINRDYNWTGGDLAIKTAVSIIQSQIRANDWVARYGGDEIVVVMPDTERLTAGVVGERIRRVLEATPIRSGQGDFHVTASIGVAEYDPESMDLQALYGAAGEAARLAKNEGKNRVVIR